MHVLIFEADAEFRDHLAQRLAERGFTVFQAGGQDEALGLARTERVRTVILGIGGLRRKALAFMDRLRGDCPGVRVILINRSGEVSLSIEAMQMGAFDEIPAPVDMEMLERKIRAPRKGA
jgi:two-component system, NtrC family, response regulator